MVTSVTEYQADNRLTVGLHVFIETGQSPNFTCIRDESKKVRAGFVFMKYISAADLVKVDTT